jgi:serine/threonine protein kinase/tetratricopeptide (TPR) repeat protein
MNCPSCDRENSATAVRCAHCGVPLTAAPDDRTMDSPDHGTIIGDAGSSPSSKPAKSKARSAAAAKTPPSNTPISQTPSQSRSSGSRSTRSGLFEAGEELGPRFVIEALLGEGGMGRVYKAYDRELDRFVALKVLQPELAGDPQIIQRFKHELLLASRISHKNILRIHDLSEADGVKFITMAFVDGQDLHNILKQEHPLQLDRSLKFSRQLCDALDAAHAEGVVHRDFKPHNVLVGKEDQVFVSDFGLATSFETAKMGMTRTGAFVGTPRYMSPEQVEGGNIDHRSDLYSLGLVIYEMVTGELPFAGESTWQVMYQRVKEKPKDPKTIKPDLPDWVARIVMHCLERDPALRYQTAREILADIDANRSPSVPHGVRFKMPSSAGRWLLAGGAGVILGGALFLAIPATRHLLFKGSGAVAPAGLPPLSEGKFIAVLPFRVLGSDNSLNYVADGLGEALSAKLFQLSDVRIASASAAFKANDQKTPLPRIAKDLGVNYIIHGLVQGAGDKLRITVNLENMVDDRLQWSQEFSGVTGDLLTLEDQIYAKLTEVLQSKAPNNSAATAHPTENVAAYDIYLRGRNALRSRQDPKKIQAAIDLFDQAIKQDPGFALAYTGMADASLLMYREKKDRFWSEKAIASAQQAERMNDNLPEVHFSLGTAYAATGQTAQAISELKRGLQLAPNSDEAYRRLGTAYQTIGQKDDAIKALQKAVEINPYYWTNQSALGGAYFEYGNYEGALKQFQIVTQLEPQNAAGYDNVGSVYSRMGRYEESVTAFQKALEIQPYSATYTNLGTSFFYLKRYSESVQMFQKAVEMSPNDETFVGNLADSYRWAGQKDKANATYDQAIGLAYKQLQVNPRDSSALGHMALYNAKKGDVAQANDFIKRARTIDPSDVYLIYTAAIVATIGNDQKAAFVALRSALQKGFATADMEADPEFTSLHEKPEYQALLKEFAPKK